MTLIVGILCSDGCVVAADGAATLGAMGQQTARQGVQKLRSINGRAILGVSGFVGLAQLLGGRLEGLHGAGRFSRANCRAVEDAMRLLRTEFWEEIRPGIQQAQVAGGLIGNAAAASAIATCLVAFQIGHDPALIQLDQQCAPEAATRNLPFIAIGSGQPMADPFLAFLRRVFWPDELPTLSEGTFAAVWAVRHAIDTMPGGVAEPMQVMQLAGDGSVRELDEGELEEHLQNVAAAREYLSRFPQFLTGGADGGGAEPEPPPEPTPAE